jgi:hypothetical protein
MPYFSTGRERERERDFVTMLPIITILTDWVDTTQSKYNDLKILEIQDWKMNSANGF